MRTGCFLAAFVLAVAWLWGPAADPGAADTIRLRTGRVLTVESVEVLEGRFRVTIPMQATQDAERAQIEFAFDKFTPKTVLKLFDRYTDRADARSVLRGGQVALDVGLPDEADPRFRKARALDAALADEAQKGLDQIPAARAALELKKLETRLRSGKDPTAVHEALEALLVGPHGVHLTAAQKRRIEVLSKLAKRLAKRAAERQAEKDKKNKPKPPAPGARKPKVPDTPPPPRDPEASPHPPGSYADRRWRERRNPRPRPAGDLPGRQRPPLQGGGGGASGGGKSGGGGRTGAGGGTAGGGNTSGGGKSSGGGASGGGQGTGLGR